LKRATTLCIPNEDLSAVFVLPSSSIFFPPLFPTEAFPYLLLPFPSVLSTRSHNSVESFPLQLLLPRRPQVLIGFFPVYIYLWGASVVSTPVTFSTPRSPPPGCFFFYCRLTEAGHFYHLFFSSVPNSGKTPPQVSPLPPPFHRLVDQGCFSSPSAQRTYYELFFLFFSIRTTRSVPSFWVRPLLRLGLTS